MAICGGTALNIVRLEAGSGRFENLHLLCSYEQNNLHFSVRSKINLVTQMFLCSPNSFL